MTIITAPHPTLRQKSQPVAYDKKLQKFVKNLGNTLMNKQDPPGVGLAAPQVDALKRVFATYLPDDQNKQNLRLFINPTVIDHSNNLILGETPRQKKARYEGCLSLPKLYGPVPRWEWLKLQYFQIENGELVEQQEVFHNFAARVIQHEYDHLEGILFTDYSLQLGLPVYEEDENEELVEVDPQELQKL